MVILITGTEVNPVVKFAVENTPAEFWLPPPRIRQKENDVTFALDTGVAEYNTDIILLIMLRHQPRLTFRGCQPSSMQVLHLLR